MNDIQQFVYALGINSTYRGFHYLECAISLCMEDEDCLLRVSKALYPRVAGIYHVGAGNVERNLRTVVSACWYRGNRELLEKIAPYPLTEKPTNSEFLDIVTHFLRNRIKAENKMQH